MRETESLYLWRNRDGEDQTLTLMQALKKRKAHWIAAAAAAVQCAVILASLCFAFYCCRGDFVYVLVCLRACLVLLDWQGEGEWW